MSEATQAAIEAAARAMDAEFCGTYDCSNLASAAITAYRNAMREAGFVEVHESALEHTSLRQFPPL